MRTQPCDRCPHLPDPHHGSKCTRRLPVVVGRKAASHVPGKQPLQWNGSRDWIQRNLFKRVSACSPLDRAYGRVFCEQLVLTALSGVGGIGIHPFTLCVCSSADFRGKSYGRLPSYCPAGTMTLDWMNACALVLYFRTLLHERG